MILVYFDLKVNQMLSQMFAQSDSEVKPWNSLSFRVDKQTELVLLRRLIRRHRERDEWSKSKGRELREAKKKSAPEELRDAEKFIISAWHAKFAGTKPRIAKWTWTHSERFASSDMLLFELFRFSEKKAEPVSMRAKKKFFANISMAINFDSPDRSLFTLCSVDTREIMKELNNAGRSCCHSGQVLKWCSVNSNWQFA